MKPEKHKPYFEKLRDPRWQKKRLEIMGRDKFSCRHCGDTEKTLNVHHCIYDKGKEPWDYEGSNLVTLCEACHKHEEFRKRLIAVSSGNSHEISVALANVSSILERSGPWSHPVFGCFLRNVLAVCMGVEGIESSKNEGDDYASLLDQELALARHATNVASLLMEIRCIAYMHVEAAGIQEALEASKV